MIDYFRTRASQLLTAVLVSNALLLGSAAAQTAGAPGNGESGFPWRGNGGYDALDYNINLKFAADKKTLVGSTTIEASATQDLSSFNLDFGSMTVSNVVVNGTAARFSQADPELTIVPEKPLVKGQIFKISVVYSGAPGSKVETATPFGFFGLTSTGITAFGEPSTMFTWSPTNENPADKATFTVQLTSQKADTGIANGELVLRTENTDGTATTTYRVGVPTSTYFIVLAVGNWKIEDGGMIGKTKIRHYIAPNTSPAMRQALAETASIVQYFSEKLVPYPYNEVGAITSEAMRGGALETQGLVTMPVSFGRGETPELATRVLAHEYAHQWFGAYLTFKTHSDMFIHEGFASYMEWLYEAERIKGGRSIEVVIAGQYPSFAVGRAVAALPKEQFFGFLKAQLGPNILKADQVARVLELIFSGSMPVKLRDEVLTKVGQGVTGAQLSDLLLPLPFTKIIALRDNLLEVLRITGGRAPNFPKDWDLLDPPGKLRDADLFNQGVYVRGAMTVHALRLKIANDDAFWKLIRAFIEKYKFGNASNQDWLAHVAELVGPEARALQERWLFDTVAPDWPELKLKASDFKPGADFK